MHGRVCAYVLCVFLFVTVKSKIVDDKGTYMYISNTTRYSKNYVQFYIHWCVCVSVCVLPVVFNREESGP